MTCGLQIRANNIFLAAPRQLIIQPALVPDWADWAAEIVKKPQQLLTRLCDAMAACLQPHMLPQRILLCMLLSAVTAGHSLYSKACAAAERSQVQLQHCQQRQFCDTAVLSKMKACTS